MKSDFLLAFNQICSARGLSSEVVLEALQMAMVSAYRRATGNEANQNITAKINQETGQAQIFIEKQVMEEITEPELEINLADARVIQADIEVGESIVIEDTPDDFGRIAAQSAKQIILQRIREAERNAQYVHYVEQEGEIVHGIVQNVKRRAITVNLEGTEAILPRSQQMPGEHYNLHQRLRAYVLEVRKTGRGPQIIISRSHKNMLRRLLELEVPEIFNGVVEIKSIAREAGSRSKVAVVARQAGVDPVGACVGMRGVRIQSIVNELGGEKIDIIEWSSEAAEFIAKALSPAKVLNVQLKENPIEGRTANVVVPDDQLSLAIGRAGQNARLSAKLTNWRIDIQGITEAAGLALRRVNRNPNVLPAIGATAELLPSVAKALRQHEQEGLVYNDEELHNICRIVEAVGDYYASVHDVEEERLLEEEAARRAAIEAAEIERQESIEAAQARIPPQAYEIPLTEFGLSKRVLGHLQKAGLEDVGEVLEHLAEGDEGLLKLNGIGPKSLAEVKECVDALDLPTAEESAAAETAVEEIAVEEDVDEEAVDEEAVDEEAVEAAAAEAAAAEAAAAKVAVEEIAVEEVTRELKAAGEVEVVNLISPRAYDILLPYIGIDAQILERLEQVDLMTVGDVIEALSEGEAAFLKIADVSIGELTEIEECIEALVSLEASAAEESSEEAPEQTKEPQAEESEPEVAEEVESDDREAQLQEERRQRRRLVYEEGLDEVIARRKRKREEKEWKKYIK